MDTPQEEEEQKIEISHSLFGSAKIRKSGEHKFLEVNFLGSKKKYEITDEVKLVQVTKEGSKHQEYCVGIEIPTKDQEIHTVALETGKNKMKNWNKLRQSGRTEIDEDTATQSQQEYLGIVKTINEL